MIVFYHGCFFVLWSEKNEYLLFILHIEAAVRTEPKSARVLPLSLLENFILFIRFIVDALWLFLFCRSICSGLCSHFSTLHTVYIYIHIYNSPVLHIISNSKLIVLNENTLLLSLTPIAPLCQRERGGARSCDPPDEVIMWKQTVWNPLLTPVTPLCYTTPDNERRQSSTGQHFLWLWLHWSWFTVILRYETRYKMSKPCGQGSKLTESFLAGAQRSEGIQLWNRNNAM